MGFHYARAEPLVKRLRNAYYPFMDDPVEVLRRRVEAQTYRALADELGFPASYLHEVVHGQRPASDNLLDALGYERIVTYRRKRR